MTNEYANINHLENIKEAEHEVEREEYLPPETIFGEAPEKIVEDKDKDRKELTINHIVLPNEIQRNLLADKFFYPFHNENVEEGPIAHYLDATVWTAPEEDLSINGNTYAYITTGSMTLPKKSADRTCRIKLDWLSTKSK